MREKLLDVNFFDKQDKLLHVSGLFFYLFPKMNYMLPRQPGESECSGPRAAVSHPEERLDGLPDKAQHAAPKTVTQSSTPVTL